MYSSPASTWSSFTTLTTARPGIILPLVPQSTQGISPFLLPQSGFPVFEPSPAFSPDVVDRLTPSLPFETAAKMFLAMRSIGVASARYVRKNTAKGYQRHTSSLLLFFGQKQLGEIHWHHMREYQEARLSGAPPFLRYRRPQDAKERKLGDTVIQAKGKTPCPCKPAQVNQELQFLKRLKKLAACWTSEDQRYFCELQEDESDVPRSLSREEQALWLDVARSRERWSLIHWYSVVAFETTMSTNEQRMLRVGDVNLEHRLIDIPWPAAKNKYRHRAIAIDGSDTLWCLGQLLRRAYELGSRDPQHHLFPFRDNRNRCHVPGRHMSESGIKKLWQEVRIASGLKWFRPYDTRHTAITRMAEDGIPVPVIMAKAGHISARMTQHYTHISLAAQRRWAHFAQEARCTPIPPYQHYPEPNKGSWHGSESR